MFDLGFDPRHNRAIAADEADTHRSGFHQILGAGAGADGAFENQALCDIVSVVFDKGFFDEEREIVLGKAQRAGFLRFFGEAQRDRVRDIRDEATVLFIENIFLFAREKEIRKCLADFIGNIGEVEGFLLAVVAGDDDSLQGMRWGGNGFAPGEVGLLVAWHGDEALERAIFVE